LDWQNCISFAAGALEVMQKISIKSDEISSNRPEAVNDFNRILHDVITD
jgi:hypothetical protein